MPFNGEAKSSTIVIASRLSTVLIIHYVTSIDEFTFLSFPRLIKYSTPPHINPPSNHTPNHVEEEVVEFGEAAVDEDLEGFYQEQMKEEKSIKNSDESKPNDRLNS